MLEQLENDRARRRRAGVATTGLLAAGAAMIGGYFAMESIGKLARLNREQEGCAEPGDAAADEATPEVPPAS